MNDIETYLLSMGYREMSGDVYGKPYAYTIFVYEISKNKLSQKGIGVDGKSFTWSSCKLKLEDSKEEILNEIAHFEYNGFKGVASGKTMHFLTIEQISEITLGGL